MQVKICGLKTTKEVETCVLNNANFCGFILNYKKSHRFINYQTAEKLTQINNERKLESEKEKFALLTNSKSLIKLLNFINDWFFYFGEI